MVIFLLGWLGHEVYSESIDYLELTDEQAMIDWGIKSVRDIALFLYVGVSIVWSIWSYKGARNKRKAKWSIVFSVGFGLFLAVSTLVMYQMYSDLVERRAAVNISDNPKINEGFAEYLNSSVHSVQQKHENSLLHGSTVFMESGSIIQVLDAEGNKVSYEPTAEDIQFRKKAERVKVLEQHSLHSLKMAWISLSTLLMLSILTGCIATGARNAYNQQLKRTP